MSQECQKWTIWRTGLCIYIYIYIYINIYIYPHPHPHPHPHPYPHTRTHTGRVLMSVEIEDREDPRAAPPSIATKSKTSSIQRLYTVNKQGQRCPASMQWRCIVNIRGSAAQHRNKFWKVFYIVTLCTKCTSALTFENVFFPPFSLFLPRRSRTWNPRSANSSRYVLLLCT